MPSLAHRMREAADTIEEFAAYTGNRHPENVAYTAAGIRIESGHVAAEQMTTALCPVCWNPVWCSDGGNIKVHRNKLGDTCADGTGEPFTSAVVTE